MSTAGKILFANQLRGIAVLCVIVAHYSGIYWGARDVVSENIYAPVAQGLNPGIDAYLSFPTFSHGPFGVALFFLISGFVIPFSLEKMGRGRFILARAIRIFPTYWIASAVTICAMWLSARYWGVEYPLASKHVIPNLFLVNLELGIAPMDLVNWTLSIEIKFYVAAALMWPFIKRGSALALVNFAVVVLAVLNWMPPAWGDLYVHGTHIWVEGAKYQLMFVPFLFIGTLFNFALREKITTRGLLGATLAIGIAFSMMWQKTVLAGQFWIVPANYGYALIVFSACYALRRRFKPFGVLDFFADISYPLYIVHALIGYATIRILMAHDWPYLLAAGSAFALVIGIAYLLHVVIESPTANLAKRLGTKQVPRASHPSHNAPAQRDVIAVKDPGERGAL
jgi:peptidoglycan/LPS O-acetylase OafA/YrhL